MLSPVFQFFKQYPTLTNTVQYHGQSCPSLLISRFGVRVPGGPSSFFKHLADLLSAFFVSSLVN